MKCERPPGPFRLLGALAIVALALLAFGNGLRGAFVFDDQLAILRNEQIGTLWPPWIPLTGPHEGPSSGRPLVALSLALNYAAGGIETFGYHVTNLVVHVLVCLLLVRLALTLFSRTPVTAARAPGLALALGVVFAVHPIGTNVVTYVAQRAESMAALFLLAGWLAWARHLAAQDHSGERVAQRGRSAGWLAVVCSYAALACKETGYALPLVAVLMDRAFFASNWSQVWRRSRGYYLAMASSWIVLALSMVFSARGATVTWTYRDYDSWTYLLTSAGAIVHYVRLVFWPDPLVLDYGWPIARELGEVAWQFAALALTFAASLACIVRAPRLAFLGLSFFVLLAPSSSVVPVVTEIMAEHRMYLPGSIVIAATLVVVDRLALRLSLPTGVARGLGLVLLLGTASALVLRTRARNEAYRDAITMSLDNVRHTPDNHRAQYNLGFELSQVGRYAEARVALEAARGIDPSYAPAHRELSYIAMYEGKGRAALAHIERAIDLKPDDPLNLTAKGSFLALVGEPAAGLAVIDRALERHPGFREALKWRVNVLLLAQKGRAADKALAEYDPSLNAAQRARELEARYRDLVRMAGQASDRP